MIKIILFLTITISLSSGIDLKKYKESPCIQPPLADIDSNWLFSVKSWNFLGGSKYGFFRFISGLQKKRMEELDESNLESLCMKTHLSDRGVVSLHSLKKKLDYVMSLGDEPAIINWRLKDADKEEDQSKGISYVTLTDNKSYLVTIQYWEHQQKAWLLMSTEKHLSEELKTKVIKHIKGFGFDLGMTYFPNYAICPQEKVDL